MPLKDKGETLKPFAGRFLKGVPAPACSRLYSLEAIGIGTPLVESLTSYILRLALAHCVRLGSLMASEVVPIIYKPYVNNRTSWSISGPFRTASRAINGFGVMSKDWVFALQNLTCRQDLRFLTLLPWKGLFAKQHLLRKMRAWCPYCYYDKRKSKSTIYDPLLWSIDVVSACIVHKRFLQHKCFHCNKSIPTLTNLALHDICPYCGMWLGCSPDIIPYENKVPTADDLRWQEYVFNNLGSMFAEAFNNPSKRTDQLIPNFISACVQRFSRGDLKAFVRRFESFSYDTIHNWKHGFSLPVLGRLMELCYLAEVPVKDVFLERLDLSVFSQSVSPIRTGESHRITPGELEKMEELIHLMLKEDPAPSILEAVRRLGCHRLTFEQYFPDLFRRIQERYNALCTERYDKDKVSKCLSAAVSEIPPPSLNTVASRIGCSCGFLRNNFPKECHFVVNRHAEYRKVFPNPEETRSKFRAFQEEFPPPTIIECAKRLECTRERLKKYFPEEYRASRAKRRDYLKKKGARKRRHYRRAIINAIHALVAEGIKPNYYQIRKQIHKGKFLTNREINSVLSSITS